MEKAIQVLNCEREIKPIVWMHACLLLQVAYNFSLIEQMLN